MDIIFTAFGILLFLSGGVALGYFVIKKSGAVEEKRPVESKAQSEIFETLQNLAEKIPGFSAEDRELSQEKGTWFTTAEFPQTWEYIFTNLGKNRMIFKDPKYAWKRIDQSLPYKTMSLNTGWEDRQKLVNPVGPDPQPTIITTTVVLELTFEPIQAGGTAIHFQYDITQNPYTVLMPPIVKETNRRLKYWCLQLSQDPNRGGIF